MVVSRRPSRLSNTVQRALIVKFVAGTPTRTAAQLVGVNRHTATLYYQKLRELIAWHLAQETPYFWGQVEVDESYFGACAKAKEAGALPASRSPSAC
jgi:transposase